MLLRTLCFPLCFVSLLSTQYLFAFDGLTDLVLELRKLGDRGDQQGAARLIPNVMSELRDPQHKTGAAALAWNEVAIFYQRQSDFQESERAYKTSLRILEKQPPSLDLATVFLNLASLYLEIGNRAGHAESICRRGLEIATELYGPEHPGAVDFLITLGAARERLGDREGAKQHLERALALTTNSESPDTGRRKGFVYANIANLHARGNQWTLARDASLNAIRHLEQSLGPTHPDLIRPYVNLARTYEQLRQWQAAVEPLARASRIVEEGFGADHPLMVEILLTSSSIAQKSGRSQQAKDEKRRAKVIAEAQPKSADGSVHVSDLIRRR
jgi:tetratricopeptide (TPR) repeat protein